CQKSSPTHHSRLLFQDIASDSHEARSRRYPFLQPALPREGRRPPASLGVRSAVLSTTVAAFDKAGCRSSIMQEWLAVGQRFWPSSQANRNDTKNTRLKG